MSDDAGILIMQIHRHSPKDHTPIQMVSNERLAYLHRMEAEALYLRKVMLAIRLAMVDMPDFDTLDACTVKSPACAAPASADPTTISGPTLALSDTSRS